MKCDQETLHYEKRLTRQVFRGKLCDTSNTQVIAKFTNDYSEEVPKFCAEKGFAPSLLSCEQIGKFKMVVMQYFESQSLGEILISKNVTVEDKKELVRCCKTALNTLHDNGCCHGDFRPENILVPKDKSSIQVIDFDWSGVADEKRYPLFMNRCIEWHKTAVPGNPLCKEHDLHFIHMMDAALNPKH